MNGLCLPSLKAEQLAQDDEDLTFLYRPPGALIFHPPTGGPVFSGKDIGGYCEIDSNKIKELLTRDAICRDLRQWPDLTPSQMSKIYGETLQLRSLEFKRNGPRNRQSGKMYTCNRRLKKDTEDLILKQWRLAEQDVFAEINRQFPYIKELLGAFNTETTSFVVAGGAVFRALRSTLDKGDIDIFSVDSEVDNENISDTEMTNKHNVILENAVTWLVQKLLGMAPHAIYLSRNEHLVSVEVNYSDDIWIKYQFIKRIWRTPLDILGGFDLGPAMIGYIVDRNGREKMIATELGAWSAFAETIIIDTSRRSTSFEHRLVKYSTYCHLIFPGLVDPLSKYVNRESIGTTMSRLGRAATKYGLEGVPINRRYSLRKRASPTVSIENAQTRLIEHAIRLGYCLKIDEGTLSKLTDDKPEWVSLPDAIRLLKEEAYTYGYSIDLEDFGLALTQHSFKGDPSSDREDLDSDDDDDLYLAFPERPSNIDLPYLDIMLDHTRGPIRVPRVYRDLRMQRPFRSDYNDSICWPVCLANENASLLVRDKLAGVVSIMVLKKSTTDLSNIYGYGQHTTNHLRSLSPCLVDIDHSGFKIGEIVHKFFTVVNLGDVISAFESRIEIIKDRLLHYSLGSNESRHQFLRRILGDYSFQFLDTLEKSASDPESLLESPAGYAKLEEIANSLRARILSNLETCSDNLSTSKWVRRQPWRQWTASYNPIMEHPSCWYGHHYKSFRLGYEPIETALRLFRLRPGNPFYSLPRDIFKIIVRMVIWENSLLPGFTV